MPRIVTNGTEQCVCTSVLLDMNKEYNIVGFEPVADMETVNHMSVVAGETFEFRKSHELNERDITMGKRKVSSFKNGWIQTI